MLALLVGTADCVRPAKYAIVARATIDKPAITDTVVLRNVDHAAIGVESTMLTDE